MKTKISPRDIVFLSEYLDGRLNTSKASQLEARLKTNSELRTALADMRQARSMLRSLPPVKAPRSFKLKPEMVGQQRAPRRMFPVFSFASAVAAILLVMVVIGDFMGLGLPTATAPSVMLAQPAAKSGSAANGVTEQASQPMATAEVPAAPLAEPRAMLSATQEPTLAAGARAETGTLESMNIQETPLAPTAMAILPPASNPLSNTVQMASPTEAAPIIGPATPLMDRNANEPRGSFLTRPLYRVAEISLASLTLVTGLAALVLRRQFGGRRFGGRGSGA